LEVARRHLEPERLTSQEQRETAKIGRSGVDLTGGLRFERRFPTG
jgi:hypothetical protein